MKKNILWILGTVIFIVLFAGAYFLYNNLSENYTPEKIETAPEEQRENSSQQQKEKAPDFKVFDKNGKEVRLKDYFGKPIVLNFWASWCPPCKEEMPHFQRAFNENDDINFLMVNATTSDRENIDSAKAYVKDNGYTFPVFYDETGEAGYLYGTSSLPMTFFIDKEGYLVTYARGMIDYNTLLKGIDMIK